MDTLQIYQRLVGSLGETAARDLAEVLATIKEELQNSVSKTEFRELKEVVEQLAQAQARTEERVGRLESAVERLAQAQARTEERVGRLEDAVEQLARAVEIGYRDLNNRFGVLGARWGDGAEETFRHGLLEMVRELGYRVEHYHGEDPEGFINHVPRSFDLDVLVQNGNLVVAEIKSNASGADVTEFHRSVLLYERQTGRQATKRILVAVTIQQAAWERARQFGLIVATGFDSLR